MLVLVRGQRRGWGLGPRGGWGSDPHQVILGLAELGCSPPLTTR